MKTLLIELVLVLVDIATVVLPVRMAYEDFYIPLRDNQVEKDRFTDKS